MLQYDVLLAMFMVKHLNFADNFDRATTVKDRYKDRDKNQKRTIIRTKLIFINQGNQNLILSLF